MDLKLIISVLAASAGLIVVITANVKALASMINALRKLLESLRKLGKEVKRWWGHWRKRRKKK